MADTRIISIPSLEFTYVDYKLESIVAGGELYIRHHSLESESAREPARVSRWRQLFGTPERAARTMHGDTPLCNMCELRGKPCDEKGYYGCPLVEDYDALLEWLRGDAE